MTASRPFGHLGALAERFHPWAAPVFLLARNSDPGRRGRKLAIDDLHHAARQLAQHGADAVPFLPPRDQLDEMLHRAEAVVSVDKNGVRFTNRFVELDLRADCGVYVLLSTGTARRLDVDDETQPFIRRATAIARRIKPALIYARRIDRLVRKAWALGPLMLALDDGWIGDERRGIRRADSLDAAIVFFDALSAEDEVDKLVEKSPPAIAISSGRRMEAGQVLYAAAAAPPPGFGLARLSNGVSRGPQVLYVDDGVSAPPPDRVAYGLSELRIDGEPVSQVDNVRFLLARLGRPQWPRNRIIDELIARKFSSTGLRRYHMDPVKVFDRAHAERMIDPVLAQLDLYETGVLRVKVSTDELSFNIENCFPIDGPWAQPEDFARLRRYRSEGRHRYDSSIRLTLAGVPVTVDGTPGRLGTADRQPRTRPPSHYVVWKPGGFLRIRGDVPLINACEVNHAIVDAIAGAGELALDLVDTTPPDTPQIVRARIALREVDEQVAALQAQEQALRARCLEPSLAGSRLLEAISKDYDGVLAELQERTGAATTAAALLETAERHAVVALPQLRIEALLELVEALRDPTTTTFSRLLRDALGDSLAFRVDQTAQTVTVTGTLTVGHGELQSKLDLQRTWGYGKAEPALDIEAVIDRLEAGALFSEVCRRIHLDVVVASTGRPRANCLFVNCTDPRIMRVGIAVTLRRRGRTNQEIADELNEPIALIHRVDDIWNQPRGIGTWRTKDRAGLRANMYIAASRSSDGVVRPANGRADYKALHQAGRTHPKDWERVPGAIRMRACTECGATSRVPVLIREVDTSICVRCRTDRSGIRWPADPYDGYVLELERFTDAGLVSGAKRVIPESVRAAAPRAHGYRHQRPDARTSPAT